MSSPDTASKETRRVGVLGVGLLGSDIVACLLAHGFEAVAVDVNTIRVEKLTQLVEKAFAELKSNGLMQTAPPDGWREKLTARTDPEELAGCDFVIESVVEDREVKTNILRHLEEVLEPDTPIASNTSSIPITELQRSLTRPERMLGLHFCQPAYASPFVEVVRGDFTSDAVFLAGKTLAERLGKEPCLVYKDAPGFVVNRIGYAMYREALHLVESGISDYESIDRAVRNSLGLFISLCGPFRWMDISGGPALYGKAMESIFPSLGNAPELPPVMARLRDEDARGTANGHGFYDYAPEDEENWDRLFREHVWKILQLRKEENDANAETTAS